MQPIYAGNLGLALAVAGNAALHLLLLPQGVPWQLLALASVVAIAGLLLGIWALVAEDTDPAKMWERAARKADRRATAYITRGMPEHAKHQLQAARLARSRGQQLARLNQGNTSTQGGHRGKRAV